VELIGADERVEGEAYAMFIDKEIWNGILWHALSKGVDADGNECRLTAWELSRMSSRQALDHANKVGANLWGVVTLKAREEYAIEAYRNAVDSADPSRLDKVVKRALKTYKEYMNRTNRVPIPLVDKPLHCFEVWCGPMTC
jgi:hypothetical protein